MDVKNPKLSTVEINTFIKIVKQATNKSRPT